REAWFLTQPAEWLNNPPTPSNASASASARSAALSFTAMTELSWSPSALVRSRYVR
ncbi:MAG: hypothetical protein ACI9HI_000553, partial [Salinirussus sp.]